LAPDKSVIEHWHNSEILLIGGSAGSFKIIFEIIKMLPANLNKAVVIVMHRKKNIPGGIEKLFAENSNMAMREITDKDIINKNTIFIAPANYHTLIEREGYFGLDVSEAVWYSKPSIDITFESAAEIYGGRCAAILLSGANQDGAAGLLKLKQAGSLTIVQDPEEAEMPEMPATATNINAACYVLSTNEIFDILKS